MTLIGASFLFQKTKTKKIEQVGAYDAEEAV